MDLKILTDAMKSTLKWDSETELRDKTPMAYKNTSTQVQKTEFSELMISILHVSAQLCRKKGMPLDLRLTCRYGSSRVDPVSRDHDHPRSKRSSQGAWYTYIHVHNHVHLHVTFSHALGT